MRRFHAIELLVLCGIGVVAVAMLFFATITGFAGSFVSLWFVFLAVWGVIVSLQTMCTTDVRRRFARALKRLAFVGVAAASLAATIEAPGTDRASYVGWYWSLLGSLPAVYAAWVYWRAVQAMSVDDI